MKDREPYERDLREVGPLLQTHGTLPVQLLQYIHTRPIYRVDSDVKVGRNGSTVYTPEISGQVVGRLIVIPWSQLPCTLSS